VSQHVALDGDLGAALSARHEGDGPVSHQEGREGKPGAAIARMVHLTRRTVYKALARQEQAG